MPVNAVGQPTLLAPSARAGAADVHAPRREEEFQRILAIAKAQDEAGPEARKAREAAEDFVAMTFIEPILAQIRESSQAAPPFAPTNGEKQFRAMMDAGLARELTRAARFPLVERLARDLRSGQRTEAQSTHAVRA
jgi:Rod binding domain-containing protein